MNHATKHSRVTTYTLLLNTLPLLYLVTGVTLIVYLQPASLTLLLSQILVWLYLVPPLICRAALLIAGYPSGRELTQHTKMYKLWWFLAQWQVIFNRFPGLEEVLRLIPGVYGSWLNLWGSRVSLIAYWGPGAKVMDRYLLRVAKGVIIGTDAVLSGHLGVLDETGESRVDVAEVVIGPGAIIGTRAMIGPGCQVAAHELVPAGKKLQPYSQWLGGRKVKP